MNEVRVSIVTNRAVNPPSELFTITECNTGELNPTTATATSTNKILLGTWSWIYAQQNLVAHDVFCQYDH